MKAEQQHSDETKPEATDHTGNGQKKMTRRDALAALGKHSVYTAPAVLAVLTATKSKSAFAVISNCVPQEGRPCP